MRQWEKLIKVGTLTWLIPVLSAAIGLIGGALGYSIQNYYAIRQEEQKNLIESRKGHVLLISGQVAP
jgi:hypothetical protein